MAWAPDYVTPDELAAHLRIVDAHDDPEMALAITAASRGVDHETNRQFGKLDAAQARTYRARPDYSGHGYWIVDIDDLMTTDDLVVTVDGTTITSAGYELGPLNAAAEGKPWRTLAFTADAEAWPRDHPHHVVITAPWGWTDVPRPVINATRIQASRLFKRRDAPFGIAGSPDQGSEVRLLAKLDPDVAVSLRGFRRARLPS